MQLTFLNKSDSLFILSVVSFILTQASSEIKNKLVDIGQDAKSGIGMLQILQKHVEELRQGVVVKSISPEAVDQPQSLLGLSESACSDIARQHIRRSLAFPDMRGRVETVEKAHADTFSWLLDRSSDPESEDRVRTRDLFLNWLSTESGIFGIAGKLGSGKSTLMKWLCHNPRTKIELQKWAGMFVPLNRIENLSNPTSKALSSSS